MVTKPFHFEGQRRMRTAEAGIAELHKVVDTLLIIPNQNLFRVANEKTTFADAFAMADQVLYSGVACITDLMVKEGLINLDFADVRAVMREMGKAMMGTGEASGEKRALTAAEAAIANPLIDDASMKGARGLLISITGGKDLTLFEVDEAATRIREEVDQDANIIVGATFDESLDGIIRVSVVATGIDQARRARASSAAGRGSRARGTRRQRCAADSQRIADDASSAPKPAPRRQPGAGCVAGARCRSAPSAAAVECRRARRGRGRDACRRPAGRGVTIRPMPPKPSLFEPAAGKRRAPEPATPAAFIPPPPERTPLRAPRMPRIDELPMPAQNEIRARRGETPRTTSARSAGCRCCSAGLGRPRPPRRGEPSRRRPACRRSRCRSSSGRCRPTAAPPEGASGRPVSEYAKRPAPQGLDPHGRPAPVHNSAEDDQLDIPAFLRRQAN